MSSAIRQLRWSLAAALLACGLVCAGEPAPLTVHVAPPDVYKEKVKVVYSPAAAAGTKKEQTATLFGGKDRPLEFKIVLHSPGKERKVHIEAVVKDFYGADVPEGSLKVDVGIGANQQNVQTVSPKPARANIGPYYLTGTFSDAGGEKGDFSFAFPFANIHAPVEDFEHTVISAPGVMETTPMASSNGQIGLQVKLPKADAPEKTRTIPLNLVLPGRGIELAVNFRPNQRIETIIHVRDSRKDAPGRWEIGPVAIDPPQWKTGEFVLPVPSNGQMKATDDGGVADIVYPLVLENITIAGPADTTVNVDDIVAVTQRDVLASVAPTSAAAPFAYSGNKFGVGGGMEFVNGRPGTAYVAGAPGKPIEIALKADAYGAERSIKFTGKVRDYNGVELPDIACSVQAKAGESAQAIATIAPTEKHQGPFYIDGAWNEENGHETGTVSLIVGYANWKQTLNDFELARYVAPGGALESSPAARHGGELGMFVRLQPTQNPQVFTQALPMGVTLVGRPAKVGVWVKSAEAVKATMTLRDPGVNHMGAMRYDTWVAGPVDVPAGDWTYVEIPVADYGPPSAQHKNFCQGNGVVDYPLTLDSIEFTAGKTVEVAVDDVELWSQTEPKDTVLIRSISNKPCELLYRNDSLTLAVRNAWLWGAAQNVSLSASLEDINGRKWPLLDNVAAMLAPGEEQLKPVSIKDLPLGPYRFVAMAKMGDKTVAVIPPPRSANPEEPYRDATYLCYEPGGKALSHPELHALLGNRNALAKDLGFEQEARKFSWDTTENRPSMESFSGHFDFDWITPSIDARRKAGIQVLGVFGGTPQFYDPGGQFIQNYREWFGSTVAMPVRSIYFEEYVHRIVEHFADKVDTWIVWERPDAPNFASPEEYTEKMLEVARRAVSEANPKAKLISGGITRENIQSYLTGMIEAGGHRYVDGIGILPSPAPLSPEDGYMDVILARAQRLRREEQMKPELWVLDLAYPTGQGEMFVSEFEQALYTARAYVMCRGAGINHIILPPDGTLPENKRDSADLIYPLGELTGAKPAAVAYKVVKDALAGCEPVRELFLQDKSAGLARAYLFKRSDGKLLVAAWRREGESTLPLSVKPESISDTFGNVVAPSEKGTVILRPAPLYMVFPGSEAGALATQLERGVIEYDDAPESAWKHSFTFHLDVGNEADEQRAHYQCTNSRLVGPIDSYYHNEYGRHLVDTGRHFKGEESFDVDVSQYGGADLLLRKRINYSLVNQLVQVYCNDQFVGQWAAPKRDRRFRWRDIEYIIPNKFLAGKSSAHLKFAAEGDSEASSYYYWAAPLTGKTIFASDLSLLNGSAGGAAAMVATDKNIIGGTMKFAKKPDLVFNKGFGTNSAATREESMIVLSVNKQYKRLKGWCGIDACTNGRGTVRFKITGLKKTLWESPAQEVMNYYSAPRQFDIDISDEIVLILSVDDGGDTPKDDIADWGDLRLELK